MVAMFIGGARLIGRRAIMPVRGDLTTTFVFWRKIHVENKLGNQVPCQQCLIGFAWKQNAPMVTGLGGTSAKRRPHNGFSPA